MDEGNWRFIMLKVTMWKKAESHIIQWFLFYSLVVQVLVVDNNFQEIGQVSGKQRTLFVNSRPSHGLLRILLAGLTLRVSLNRMEWFIRLFDAMLENPGCFL